MIPIVLSSDHNFIMPTGVSISSLLKNSDGEIYDINILISEDVTPSDKLILSSIVEHTESKIHFKLVKDLIDTAYEVRGITKAAYFRLYIPWLFPDYKKIIYLDGDIVIKKGLKKLYDIDLSDNYIGGVKDIWKSSEFIKYIDSIGLNWDDYINSGILLFNAKKMREDRLDFQFNKLCKLQFEYQDQDILNTVCKNKIQYISPAFNFNAFWFKDCINNPDFIKKRYNENNISMLQNIHIIHYCGAKPWNNYNDYLWADWLIEYKKTPFYDLRKELSLYDNNIKLKSILKLLKRYILHLLNK